MQIDTVIDVITGTPDVPVVTPTSFSETFTFAQNKDAWQGTFDYKFDKYIQTNMQRVRKIEQQDVSTSDVRLKIEGMVYSLLSTNTRSQYDNRDPIRQPAPRPRISDWGTSRSRPSPFADYYRQPETVREEFGRTKGRYDESLNPRHGYDTSPAVNALQRDALSIDNAIQDTVYMLRNGQLMAEDFIRRYKELMRDSFHNRREMEQISRNARDSLW